MLRLQENCIIGNYFKYKIALLGIAIGNGWVSEKLSVETDVLYQYYHGLIDEDDWKNIMNCCNGKIDGCDLKSCKKFSGFVEKNSYDLHSTCSQNVQNFDEMFKNAKHQRYTFTNKLWWYRKNQHISSKVNYDVSQECVPKSSLQQYLNTPEVRNSLHIPPSVIKWRMCSYHLSHIEYQSPRNSEQSENIRKIVGNNIRTLLYYGDVDSVCNFVMGQKFSNQLGLKKISAKSAWFYDDQIIGGYKTVYDNLTFLTINGAGHMVPQTHPRSMQHILQRFIEGTEI